MTSIGATTREAALQRLNEIDAQQRALSHERRCLSTVLNSMAPVNRLPNEL